MKRENFEDHPRNIQARNTNSLRIQEEYITQVSEKIGSRLTKNLSQKFSRTERRILGALLRLDEFLQNPKPRVRSGTGPETSRNLSGGNQGTMEDGSQSDPHPEVGVALSLLPQELSPEETCYRNVTF